MAVLKVIGIGEHGKFQGPKSFQDLNDYCGRYNKTLGFIGGRAVYPQYAADEMLMVTQAYGKEHGLNLRHMVLSFDPKEISQPEYALALAYTIAGFYSNRYQIFYGVHCDTKKLHIHFAMNKTSYIDGKKYNGTKKDYYDFRNYISCVLREVGMHLQN